MGLDIGAPIGTALHAFYGGEIFLFGYNGKELDYGHTLITRHVLDGKELYCLLGHLSQKSMENKKPGQKIRRGEVIAWVGDFSENGGWFPHVHVQLSYERPKTYNMPGVVSEQDHAWALKTFPDPRNILGAVY
jgi:murein DD-endopeptidase MepM/ murein hydrolase activator NlpD